MTASHKGRRLNGLTLTLLYLLSPLTIATDSPSTSPTSSPVATTPTTTTAATTATTPAPTIELTPVEFPINLPKYSCSESGATSTPGTPVHLTSISTGSGDKTILLSPLVDDGTGNAKMCILSRWSGTQVEQANGVGNYHPLGRSVVGITNGEWTRPPGKPSREVTYVCGAASNSGTYFDAGEYLCQVTLPWTKITYSDYTYSHLHAPYYMTYYERDIGVRNEISRFLHKGTFGPISSELDEMEAAHTTLMSSGLSSQDAMETLFTEWTKKHVDPASFADGFTSLRKYWRKRVNARAFEVYLIGEAGPAPCEKNSRWRKFVFTNYDVQNSQYLRWGDDGVTAQNQKGHRITVETVDLRSPTDPPVTAPTPPPVSSPTPLPVSTPTLSPTISSAPTGTSILGYGDLELNPADNETSVDAIKHSWSGSCATDLTSAADDVHSGEYSLAVTGGTCSVLRMMGTNCPANRMPSQLAYGDTIKISLWVKMAEASQVFQMFTGHYHPRKNNRWGRPVDDSHVISRTLIDNAGKWKFIEAYHTVGPDWTFEGEVLEPKLCNHYQLRFNLAKSTANYFMDDVRIERVGSLSDEDKQVLFLRNPSFVSSHKNWRMAASSGTNVWDDEMGQTVMQIKKGQVLRQNIYETAIPGEKYNFGMWVKLLDSQRPIDLKVILRMRFRNNDKVYGPCKNSICNLYKRPVRTTISNGSEEWQHVIAEDFEMYGNYTNWDGTVDFILFQVTTSGMPNSASLRIANFHDLDAGSVPPSMSLVPSSAPTSIGVEDVAYIVYYAGLVRTVVKNPFQIDSTGEILPMDGSVEYELCYTEEVEGKLSDSPKGMGFIVDGRCEQIRGGNPTVDLDPQYLNMTGIHLLDLTDPNVTSLKAINAEQTYGGDLLLEAAVQDDACDTFPSPYDNDYRGANDENPDAVPNRFDPDANVFALLPDGTYAIYDPRIILHENSLESPLMDGGGPIVLRSTLRSTNGFTATQRGSDVDYYTSNDQNIVLCMNEQPNFVNREHCVLSYEENTCVVGQPYYVDEKQRHNNVNVQIVLTFDNDTLAGLHGATASSYQAANETANTTEVDNQRYVYAMSGLRFDESNTNGSYPLPCLEGNPRSRWIPRTDLDSTSCTNTLQDSSVTALANALENSNDANSYLRDIYLWNSVAEDGCDAADALEYGMLIMTESEGCWENVHPDYMSIYDYTYYVAEHPSTDSSLITGFTSNGIMEYPSNHPMSYFEQLKETFYRGETLIITPIARYGDTMIVDEFSNLIGINVDPVALLAVADLGEIKLNNALGRNRGGGTLVCGSPNEVVPDPTLDDFFDVVHQDLACVGCQKSYGDYFAQKQTVWALNALEAEDQFCGRMAWALYELVNVGTTTAPDNTESNLYTYDIFKRHCFGNYYDILKEMSYNPKMGEQFGFVTMTSTRYRYDRSGEFIYPDENYAREIMQLYSIGLHYLNDDGTEVRDQFGRVIQTYTNEDILSNSRIWSGFEYTARRGNVEELFRAQKSRHDPMRIIADRHDYLPKFTLGNWVGKRYPLCSDLPDQPFLKIGAEFHLRGGSSAPNSQSMPSSRDGDEGIKRFVLSKTSSLYSKLCNADANGTCQFSNTVVLDENLACDGKECRVDSVVIVQVAPGVFYEYVRPPCIHKAFYNNAKKVVTGIEWLVGVGLQYTHGMCADPTTASAARSCCDADGNKVASYDYKFEYHGEKVTASRNEQQCTADGLTVCDPMEVTLEGFMDLDKLYYYNHAFPSTNTFYWTDSECTQYLKIRSDGMVAFIHEPVNNTAVDKEEVVPFVSLEDSVTYITMPWEQDIYTLEYLYPSSEDNSCDNGACSTLSDGSCLCPVSVAESAVFGSMPNRTAALSQLEIGGFDPSIFSDSSTPYSLVDSNSEIEAYSTGSVGDASTIFKVTDEYGETLYLKNQKMDVTIGSSYTMSNPVSFMDLSRIDELDATYEVEAFLKYLLRHQNTPAFISKKLIQYFGVSNPTPGYAERVTEAFKAGSFAKNGVTFGDGMYGNLAAVGAAILLDPEALNVVIDDDPINGNIREPLLKVIQTMRTLLFTRRKEAKLATGLLKDLDWKIGQMVFQPPDQFSFFSSDYSPPGVFTDLELVAPESELLSMGAVVGMTNGFFSLVNFGLSNADGGFGPFISKSRSIGDYSNSVGYLSYQVNGTDAFNKINDMDTMMMGGRLGAGTRQVLTDAYDYFLEAYDTETADRVLTALTLASPEFHTSNTLTKTGSKRAVTPPPTKSSEPYKAIVYIYLSGGIDSFNILAPHSESGCYLYEDYREARGGSTGVGLEDTDMLTIDGSSAGIDGCNTFGVNKALSSFKEIYDEGKGIFFANMGHLHKPVSKTNWMTETRTDLFSHHTMKKEAQLVDAFREGAGPGVLGRMLDIFEAQGHAVAATCVNVQSPMVDGDPSTGRYADAMSTEGLPKVFERQFLNRRTGQEFRMYLEDLNAETTDNSGVMSNLWSQRFIDVWDKTDTLVETMRGTTLATPFAQQGADIGAINQQLKLVAQLMLNRDKRGNGVNRDVFFVEMGGFDTHSDMRAILNNKLPALNRAVGNFWAEIKAQGLDSSVTVVQGSEFGRTITPNSNSGSDHAWGGNYFMFGGGVAGGKILGEYPTSFGESDSRNIGRGRLIPSRSWDSMWYGITQWFGITVQDDIDYVLPNSQNFGCSLFTDKDLYTSGTNEIQGCGGPVFAAVPAEIEIPEVRMLTGEEQKGLCRAAAITAGNQLGTNPEDSRCYIADMVIAPSSRRRLTGTGTYTVTASAELNFDATIPPEVASYDKVTAVMSVASKISATRIVLGAIPNTEAPSVTPSAAPSVSAAPSTATAEPTRAPVAPLGLEFTSADIGYCAYSGDSYETADGTYVVEASGADIWGTEDAFHYMYVETSGDADVSALVESLAHRHEWSKVGIMFRASLAKDSVHYTLVYSAVNGVHQEHRRFTGYLTEDGGRHSIASPVWLRVTKVGNVLTAFYKENTSSFWVPFGVQLSMTGISSNGYYIGIAVTSHANDDPTLASAVVSNVDLYRTCTSESITAEQCEQATNCELGLRTLTCYDSGVLLTRRVKVQLPGTNYLHLAEVEVLDEYGDNVALNKPARMSSVYDPYYYPYPDGGVDGAIVGSMFHTDIEEGAWWEVDLVDPVEVKEVLLYNRLLHCDAGCQHRADGALILLIDDTGRVFDSRDVGVVQTWPAEGRRRMQNAPQPLGQYTFTGIPIGSFPFSAKKVKIQLTTLNFLHLLEVEVFDEEGTNRALHKPATQSSDYSKATDSVVAGNGVDGNIAVPMFHTDWENGAWWQVDLGDAPVRVKQVVLHQRTDCCTERISNAVVSLINDQGKVFDQKNVGDTNGVFTITLNFEETKKSVLPPKEFEDAGHFEYFGDGWCRDSSEVMYDYLRYYIEGVTPDICQDKCAVHFRGLTGISTFSSYYCYCWYSNNELPSPLPSDVHAFSASHAGTGEVNVTKDEQDSDCYKFFENVVDTETPTQMPTDSPTQKPTAPPTAAPTQKPTAKPTEGQVEFDGAYTNIGNGYCKDSRMNYYDYMRYNRNSATACGDTCKKTAGFRGFSMYQTLYCYCWYEDGKIAKDPNSGVYTYTHFAGKGPITQIQYTGYSTCYVFTQNE